MKRIVLLGFAVALSPAAVSAQSPEALIERAVLAAPARLRAEATVLQLNKDGTITVVRQGSNGLMCWDNAGRPGYNSPVDSECSTEANRTRLAENHAIQHSGGTPEEIQARFDALEANKTRAVSQYGSIYYRVRGNTVDEVMPHTTVAVPFATAESTGLPERGGPAALWLMQGGTSYAHFMVSGI